MTFWIDFLTAKQAIFFKYFMERYNCIATTRQYSESVTTMKNIGIKADIIGRHGTNLIEKLIFSVERTKLLLDWFLEKKPNALINHGSVEASRIAFQAGIPIFDFNDTPESIYVAKLVCPLTTLMIVPENCRNEFKKYGAERVIEYEGLTQVTWLRRHKVDYNILNKLGFDENKITVLVRDPAYYASHIESNHDTFLNLVNELKKFEKEINLIPIERYKGKFLDVQSLLHKCDIVIATGTIVGEAILCGVPLVIDYFPVLQKMYEKYAREGLMLHLTNKEMIIREVKSFLSNPKKRKEILYNKLEDPLDIFDEILKKEFPQLVS
jgi:predicted glycosyltransferase